MNKQELIKKVKEIGIYGLNIFGTVVEGIPTKTTIKLIEQLDEPEKVKVPQFVADWYEKHKDNLEYDIWEYILHWGKQQKSEFYEWMNYASNKPFQTLANMHQFGYEVEKEKRYFVKIKATKHCFAKDGKGKIVYSLAYKGSFTKAELEKAGFSWVFDCEGIEIEEAEK
jgi:hypothetical protein